MQQLKKTYLCNNADLPCKYFVERTEFVLRPGEEERCPACRKADISLVRTDGGAGSAGSRRRKWGIGIAVVLAAGVLCWMLWGHNATTTPTALPAPVAAHGSAGQRDTQTSSPEPPHIAMPSTSSTPSATTPPSPHITSPPPLVTSRKKALPLLPVPSKHDSDKPNVRDNPYNVEQHRQIHQHPHQ